MRIKIKLIGHAFVMNKSIFEKDFEGFEKYPKLDKDIKVDIAVVGGGLAGLLCAYHLTKDGYKVTVFEAGHIGAATTAKSTATLTALQSPMYTKLVKKYKFAGGYFEAQKEALQMYKQIIDEFSIDCDFEIKPSYLYAVDGNKKSIKKLKKEYKVMKDFGCDVEYTQSDYGPAIKAEDQAQFNLLKFLKGLPKDFDMYENTRIVNFIFKENKLRTENGKTIKADKIIVATRFPAILNNKYFLKMYQAKSYVITFKHQLLDGIYSGVEDSGFYMRSYGDYMLLGGFDHRAGRHKKKVNYYDKLKASAKELFGIEEGDIKDSWSAMDSVTYDAVPFAGSISKKKSDVFVITGFNEWGVLNSMICSRVVSNCIAPKDDKFKTIFIPRRHYCRKNFGSFLHHALIATWAWVCSLFRVRKACKHIGCGLRYNHIENVYECPCHGSRYDRSGKLLDGPATKNL